MKKKDGGAPAAATAANQDLMCRLLEEGRPHTRPAAAVGRQVGTGNDAALKRGIRWFCNVAGLIMLAGLIMVHLPWIGTSEQVFYFVVGLVLCPVLPIFGYWVSKQSWDDDDDAGGRSEVIIYSLRHC
ncbi:hypothetical protein ACP70R_033127 [Stipagrostis hirtigluma subsp. patula]